LLQGAPTDFIAWVASITVTVIDFVVKREYASRTSQNLL